VRITLSADVVTSPRYMREPPHFLADFGSFSRFRLQEKHNASLFQYVLQNGIIATMPCKDTQSSSNKRISDNKLCLFMKNLPIGVVLMCKINLKS
jgi:hypothetical protein